ncbi:MAG: hypothetical protein P8H17_01310 [Flavobacteriales bacterium]|nr:hypothetical protein [Flavobacteriales bacterium]
MKIFYVIILSFLVLFSTAQSNNLHEIRDAYLSASDSQEKVKKLLQLCDNDNINRPIILAYKTVAEMMLISYYYNPFKKLEIFNDKSKYLDLIIKNNINNLEIRFLRYCLQKKSPSFLGYNKELDIDYKFILRNINNHPQETQVYIYSIIRSL